MQQKQTKGLLLALGAIVLAILVLFLIMGTIFQFTTNHTQDYFLQVDNTKVSEITPHGGMSYRYTIQAFRADGSGQQIDFDTSRVLREEAFVRLEVAPVRGIISWSEVDYEELPAAVQGKYKE